MTTNDMKLPWRMAYTDTGAAVIDEDNFFLAEDIGISQAAYIAKAANMHHELVDELESMVNLIESKGGWKSLKADIKLAKQLLERAKQ